MRIAAYLRVSTDQQSHASQRAELEDYCRRRGWVDVRWFTDTASGAKSDREGLGDLMEQVRRGKLDAVVTFKLDRLARSLPRLVQILAELQTCSVALVCPSRNIDTSTANPAAMLQINVLAAADGALEGAAPSVPVAKPPRTRWRASLQRAIRKRRCFGIFDHGFQEYGKNLILDRHRPWRINDQQVFLKISRNCVRIPLGPLTEVVMRTPLCSPFRPGYRWPLLSLVSIAAVILASRFEGKSDKLALPENSAVRPVEAAPGKCILQGSISGVISEREPQSRNIVSSTSALALPSPASVTMDHEWRELLKSLDPKKHPERVSFWGFITGRSTQDVEKADDSSVFRKDIDETFFLDVKTLLAREMRAAVRNPSTPSEDMQAASAAFVASVVEREEQDSSGGADISWAMAQAALAPINMYPSGAPSATGGEVVPTGFTSFSAGNGAAASSDAGFSSFLPAPVAYYSAPTTSGWASNQFPSATTAFPAATVPAQPVPPVVHFSAPASFRHESAAPSGSASTVTAVQPVTMSVSVTPPTVVSSPVTTAAAVSSDSSSLVLGTTRSSSQASAQTQPNASVTLNVFQSGANVVSTGSGTIDLTDLSAGPTGSSVESVCGSEGRVFVAAGSFREYPGISGPASFGTGSQINASSGSGVLGIMGDLERLVVPINYTSGSELSETATWNNQSISSLGLTPGTYTWTWGSGVDADALTLNIAPEPGSFLLIGTTGSVLLLFGRWRRRGLCP